MTGCDMTALINNRLPIREADALNVKQRLVSSQFERIDDLDRDIRDGELLEGDDLGAGLLTYGSCFVSEAHKTLQIIVEHVFTHKCARTLTELEQALRNEATKGLVGGGAASFEALSDLALGEKLRTWHVLRTAEELPQFGDELLMK